MKNIKFRIYNKKTKKMESVWSIDNARNLINDKPSYYFINNIHEKKSELMQYTGLKDCKGVEIYEGDILKYGSCVEVVFYEPTMGRFMTELKKCNDESEIGEISSLSPYYTDNYEVIGNIYENKELLK